MLSCHVGGFDPGDQRTADNRGVHNKLIIRCLALVFPRLPKPALGRYDCRLIEQWRSTVAKSSSHATLATLFPMYTCGSVRLGPHVH